MASTAPTASSSTVRSHRSFLPAKRLNDLSKRHDLSRNLIRIWIRGFEAGALDEDVVGADRINVKRVSPRSADGGMHILLEGRDKEGRPIMPA